jgi:hypothetical protein
MSNLALAKGGTDAVVKPYTHELDPGFNNAILLGMPVTTIAKRVGKMRTPNYINVHTHCQRQWFTFGPLEGEINLNELTDVANPVNRRISCQTANADKVKPEAFDHIINVVFRYNQTLISPLDAAELLNPRRVKQTDKYPTARERREYTKNNVQRLPAYPVTLVHVKWRDSSNLTWETASELKRLLSRRRFEVERKIYGVALYRATQIEPFVRRNRYQSWFGSYQGTIKLDTKAIMPQKQDQTFKVNNQNSGKLSVIAAVARSDALQTQLPCSILTTKVAATHHRNHHEVKENSHGTGALKDHAASPEQEMMATGRRESFIERLPVELIVQIYNYLLEGTPFHQDAKDPWISLKLTCRKFNLERRLWSDEYREIVDCGRDICTKESSQEISSYRRRWKLESPAMWHALPLNVAGLNELLKSDETARKLRGIRFVRCSCRRNDYYPEEWDTLEENLHRAEKLKDLR